jgi:hypothetical protein
MSQYRNMQNQGRSVFLKSPLPGREGEGRGIAERCASAAAGSRSEERAEAGGSRLQAVVRLGVALGLRVDPLSPRPLIGLLPPRTPTSRPSPCLCLLEYFVSPEEERRGQCQAQILRRLQVDD